MNEPHFAPFGAEVNENVQDLEARRWARRRHDWLDQVFAAHVSDSAKVVARVISGFVNERYGKAWPSAATIGAKCGKAERTVRRLIAELRTAGFILTKLTRFGGSLEYRLAVPAGQEWPPRPAADGRPDRPDVAGEPSTEQSSEPRKQTFSTCTVAEGPSFDDRKVTELRPIPDLPKPTTIQAERATARRPWPEGMVARGINENGARNRVGVAAANWISPAASKFPDGRWVDQRILEAIPDPIMAALLRLCRKGLLRRADLAGALAALDLFPIEER